MIAREEFVTVSVPHTGLEDEKVPGLRTKRSPIQDWVDMREKRHHVLVTTNAGTHGRPYIYLSEVRRPSNLTVPASVVVKSNKFDPRMRLSMDRTVVRIHREE